MGSCSLTSARAATQDGQGPERGRILRGAAPDVQGLLQADGHQQGWPAGQERPARTPTPRRRRRRRRRRPPSKLAAFYTFLPRLWPTLTSRPTLKTPHSKQDTDNMGAEIIQTILSPGI